MLENLIEDTKAKKLVEDIVAFFKSKNLKFYNIANEQQGTSQYITVSVSIKVK